jgi:hypothetical protein
VCAGGTMPEKRNIDAGELHVPSLGTGGGGIT